MPRGLMGGEIGRHAKKASCICSFMMADRISRSRCRMYVILFDGRQKVSAKITSGAAYDPKKAHEPKND